MNIILHIINKIKVFFLAAICALAVTSPAASTGKKNIIDYYRLAPDGMLGGMKYSLVLKEGKFSAYNPNGANLDVAVDIPKGFLMVSDTKTYENSRKVVQLTLINTEKNGHLIGVNWFTEDSTKGISSGTGAQFYKYTESQMDGCCWENVNSKLFRLPEIGDFLNPVFDISKSKGLNDIIVETDKEYGLFRYSLLQSGSVMTISLNLSPFEYLKATAGSNDKQAIQALMNNIRYREMKYQWDPKEGKFEVTGKK